MTTHDAELPLLSKIAYQSGYYVSYGVVFPAAFLLHVIPGARAVTSGFVDGAAAARKYVDSLHHPAATSSQPDDESQSIRLATVSA